MGGDTNNSNNISDPNEKEQKKREQEERERERERKKEEERKEQKEREQEEREREIERKKEEERKEQKEREKAKILKGSYEDRFKIENKDKDPLEFYDIIIDIDSFSKKPEIIWKILTKKNKIMNEEQNIVINNTINKNSEEDKNRDKTINNQEQQKIKELKEDIFNPNEENIIIGVIGLGNVGKSYLLSLFIGKDLPTGDSIHTKGISIKKERKVIILDSEGVEAPLTKFNISEDLYPKENLLNKEINESDSLIQTIAKDKKAVELFIQDFIIEKSNILFIVVGQLTLTEQKLIYRIVKESNKSLFFVIHNLKNLYSKEQIDNYIENTFKKNIFLNKNSFSEQSYKKINDESEVFNKYYIESDSTETKKKVIHLIMASNLKGSEAGYYYNKTAVDYVRTEISAINNGKKFNIIEELKKFILKEAEKYVELESSEDKMPFNEDDIKIEKEGEIKYIKINNKTILKKCLINQLGFTSFYGGLYNPNYTCYLDYSKDKKEQLFIIDINLCGESYNVNMPKREDIPEKDINIITITGTKKLKEYNNIEVLEGSNMDSGNFRIDIIVDNNKYKFKPTCKVIKHDTKKGLYRFTYTLLN